MTNQVNTREIVLDILLAVTRDGEFCHVVLQNVLTKYAYLEKRDRSFISRITHGTLERMPELDAILNQFSNVKVNKMKPVIRCILRSALYQMLYMDGVPDSAACNEAVKLAGKRGFKNLKGFVNGVLRNISRNKNAIKYPDKSEFVEYMEMKYSILPWMSELWLESMSEDEVEELGKAFLTEGPTCVRVSKPKEVQGLVESLSAQGITVKRHEIYEDVLYISDYDSLNRIDEFERGQFYVQDISSMEIARVLEPKTGEIGVDVCSAPGGKSIHVAQIMDPDGQGEKNGVVYARDLTPMKVELIEEHICRTGVKNVIPQCYDATVLDEEMVGKADFVIADLPCSGLGIIRKKPDIKYHTSIEKVEELSALQQKILSVVNAYVKEGGKLIFSTCTINHLENQDNTKAFLEKHPQFQLIKEKQMLPKDGRQDGFYYALFKKGAK